MQTGFNSAAATKEGKRAGITATEIANTLEAVLGYFNATKSGDKKFLKAINDEAKAWRDQIAGLRGADQEKLDAFFGQPAPKDVTAALAASGLTLEGTPEQEFLGAYFSLTQKMTKDPAAYWPGKPVPTLGDYRDILAFDAYRETLDGKTDGPATMLVQRLDAFEGASGSKHGAGTGLISAIAAHINATPRHPAEVYTPPAEVRTDYLNAFHHTYSGYVTWRPTADMQSVTTEACRGYGVAPDKKDSMLAHEAAKFTAALARGGIAATVEPRHGATYGEDCVRVTMSMDDYTKRFIPIMTGDIEIDTSIPGDKHAASFSTVDEYTGYEPGKRAFFERENLLVSAAELAKIEAAFPPPALERAAEALDFLKAVNAVARRDESLPAPAGAAEKFARLTPQFPVSGDKVTEVEGFYYSSTDLHNKINACLREVECAINGKAPPEPSFLPREDVTGLDPFECNGNIYIPRSDKSYQAALYMQKTHGTDYSWVVNDKDAQPKCNGKDVYVIFTGKLDGTARADAVADLYRKLQEDPADARARAATILRRKTRVPAPLSLKPKTP